MLVMPTSVRGAVLVASIVVAVHVAESFVGGFWSSFGVSRAKTGDRMTSRSATLIAKPPTPTDTEVDYRKSPFAQCLVEFNKPDGSLHGESWLFHMDAAFEDTRRAEKKPSFPRLLKKSSYIWGRDTNVRCVPLDSLSGVGGNCLECVRLFVGGTYGGGVIVPAVDYQQPNKTSWQPSECLQLRVFGQPPVGDDITFSETGGGSAPGHEQRMSTFCRVASFPHLG